MPDLPHDSYLDTRERFNDERVARSYVHKKNVRDSSKNRREMACIVQALEGVAAGSRVLDLPCGTGRLESMLLDKGFEVVAADYSLPMIEAARDYYAETLLKDPARSARLSFVQQDVMNTTFDDDWFDAVICNRLIHHYPEPETRRRVLTELARICRGPLVVSYYDNFALSALKFRMRKRIRGVVPVDRIPISRAVFQADYQACGLRCTRTLPVRYGVSPQTYLVLEQAA
jgi:2-polyprenyl-3-methyl-5-hydroxy-6-metoxy-1,4-benzoquinol methylase